MQIRSLLAVAAFAFVQEAPATSFRKTLEDPAAAAAPAAAPAPAAADPCPEATAAKAELKQLDALKETKKFMAAHKKVDAAEDKCAAVKASAATKKAGNATEKSWKDISDVGHAKR